jgi:hypothetical protein
MNISEFIPFDELHWNEDEQRYIALSDEELGLIVLNAYNAGYEDPEQIMGIVNYLSQMKVDGMLYEKFIKGHINISVFENSELVFKPVQ